MKVLVISDSHGFLELPDKNPDLVLLLGDIDYYELRKIDEFFKCPKFGVLGNHDGPDFFEGTSIKNLHCNVIEFEGLKFAGFEGCPRYNRRKYLQYVDEEVYDFTCLLDKIDIFIAHSHPQFTPVEDTTNPHRGFKAFGDFIKEGQPKLFIHGHLHEPKVYNVNNTKIISVYPAYEFEI